MVKAERDLLVAAGHTVRLHEAENPTSPLPTLGALAVSAWNPTAAREAGRAAAEFAPDVAHVHNTWFSLSSSVLAAIHRRGVPVVTTVHNYRLSCLNGQLYRDGAVCVDCVGRNPLPGVRHSCYRDSTLSSVAVAAAVSLGRSADFWQRQVTRFVVMTDFARTLLTTIGVAPEKVWVKPHFALDPGPRSEPPSASPTVVYVGRLSEEKGIRDLLEAWRRAHTGDLELVVVGDGPLRPRLEAALPGRVKLVGWLPADQVRETLLSARALVFPSVWYETFGVVLIEAMAAGLPVLASRIAGVPEVVGETMLATPGAVGEWADRLGELAHDGHIDRAGAANRAAYQERYSPEQGLSNLEALYRSVT